MPTCPACDDHVNVLYGCPECEVDHCVDCRLPDDHGCSEPASQETGRSDGDDSAGDSTSEDAAVGRSGTDHVARDTTSGDASGGRSDAFDWTGDATSEDATTQQSDTSDRTDDAPTGDAPIGDATAGGTDSDDHDSSGPGPEAARDAASKSDPAPAERNSDYGTGPGCPGCGDEGAPRYECPECGVDHCADCRLPDDHDCPARDDGDRQFSETGRPDLTGDIDVEAVNDAGWWQYPVRLLMLVLVAAVVGPVLQLTLYALVPASGSLATLIGVGVGMPLVFLWLVITIGTVYAMYKEPKLLREAGAPWKPTWVFYVVPSLVLFPLISLFALVYLFNRHRTIGVPWSAFEALP